jgi:hypothetical protein
MNTKLLHSNRGPTAYRVAYWLRDGATALESSAPSTEKQHPIPSKPAMANTRRIAVSTLDTEEARMQTRRSGGVERPRETGTGSADSRRANPFSRGASGTGSRISVKIAFISGGHTREKAALFQKSSENNPTHPPSM